MRGMGVREDESERGVDKRDLGLGLGLGPRLTEDPMNDIDSLLQEVRDRVKS